MCLYVCNAGESLVKSSQDLKGCEIDEAGRQLPTQSDSTQRPAMNAWAASKLHGHNHALLHCDLSKRTELDCSALHGGMCLKAKLHGGCE